MWGFPKGRREHGETSLTAALRELREETGKVVSRDIFTNSFPNRRDRLYFARGDFSPMCVVDNSEIDDYDWISLEDLKNRKTSRFTQHFFGKLDKILKMTRCQDVGKNPETFYFAPAKVHVPRSVIFVEIDRASDDFLTRGYRSHVSPCNYGRAKILLAFAKEIVIGEGIILNDREIREFPYVMLGHYLRSYDTMDTRRGVSENEIFTFYTINLGVKSAKRVINIHNNWSWRHQSVRNTRSKSPLLQVVLRDASLLCTQATRDPIPGIDGCNPPDIGADENQLINPAASVNQYLGKLTYKTSKKILSDRC